MKKIIALVIMIVTMMLFSTNVFAGSIPDDLLFYDDAQLFFGEVISHDKSTNQITVIPTQKIKGDIYVGEKTYKTFYFTGNKATPVNGETYLMVAFGEAPLYICKISGADTRTLKIHDDNTMWLIMQNYLNEGECEAAEAKRISGSSDSSLFPTRVPKSIYRDSQIDKIFCFIGGAIFAVIVFNIIIFIKKRKNR